MTKILFIALMAIFISGCSNESDSRRTLESAGYTDVVITGWEPFTCGKDDTFSTGFHAKNPAGNAVSGVVCCGLVFKLLTQWVELIML